MRFPILLFCGLAVGLLPCVSLVSAEEGDQMAALDALAIAVEADAAESGSDDKAAAAEEEAEPKVEVVFPTHKQTKVISTNPEDLEKARLRSFCLTPDGMILAACSAEQGEVRLFSPSGEYLSTWELPVDPEAINVGSDGYVYVAGAGKVFRLSDEGQVVLEANGPHLDMDDEKRAEIRKSIIEQQKASVERYEQMAERYTGRYKEISEAAAVLAKNGIKLEKAQQRKVANAKRMADQWEQILDQIGAKELTEEQIDQRVTAAIKRKSAVASISESGGEVFLATSEATGYGFCVWRTNSDFAEGEVIAKGLRGCCGQMDVQVGENGVYVAENSRHRVYHVSRTGEEVGSWGHGARNGLEGFGSCCNPMNVAFGPSGDLYTAESGTGRIKRYTPDGKLIELVGKVDIVPGCKKVSIAVDKSGDRVYMMDITRHHIVLMERLSEDEESSYSETRTVEVKSEKEQPEATFDDLFGQAG